MDSLELFLFIGLFFKIKIASCRRRGVGDVKSHNWWRLLNAFVSMFRVRYRDGMVFYGKRTKRTVGYFYPSLFPLFFLSYYLFFSFIGPFNSLYWCGRSAFFRSNYLEQQSQKVINIPIGFDCDGASVRQIVWTIVPLHVVAVMQQVTDPQTQANETKHPSHPRRTIFVNILTTSIFSLPPWLLAVWFSFQPKIFVEPRN